MSNQYLQYYKSEIFTTFISVLVFIHGENSGIAELDGIAGIVTVGHTAVVDIAVVGQSIAAVCIELYRLMSDEIDSRLRIIGLRLMLMIELSFPFSCNRLGVVLKSFYATLFYVCECLSIIYSCILL